MVMMRPRKHLASVHFTKPLSVAENDPLDLIGPTVFHAPIEEPIAPNSLVGVRVIQVNICCPPFKMHIRGAVARISFDSAVRRKIIRFLRKTPGRAAADDFT